MLSHTATRRVTLKSHTLCGGKLARGRTVDSGRVIGGPHRSPTRTWLALALGAAGLTALTVGLNGNRGPASLTTAALLYLVPVVVLAVIGGVWPALAAALASDALLNWFFVPPYHTFTVENRENVL